MERDGFKHEFLTKWKSSLTQNLLRHSATAILLICKDFSLPWNLEILPPWFSIMEVFKKLLSLKRSELFEQKKNKTGISNLVAKCDWNNQEVSWGKMLSKTLHNVEILVSLELWFPKCISGFGGKTWVCPTALSHPPLPSCYISVYIFACMCAMSQITNKKMYFSSITIYLYIGSKENFSIAWI